MTDEPRRTHSDEWCMAIERERLARIAELEARLTAMEAEADAAKAHTGELTVLLREARGQWGVGSIFAEDRDLCARIDKAVPPEPV
jgi:hypothetical protein